MIFVGRLLPEWVLEKYIPDGDIRLPRKGEYFWSEIRNAVVEALDDETTGGGRIILNARDMLPVQPKVLERVHGLRLVPKNPETENTPHLPEVPPGTQEKEPA